MKLFKVSNAVKKDICIILILLYCIGIAIADRLNYRLPISCSSNSMHPTFDCTDKVIV